MRDCCHSREKSCIASLRKLKLVSDGTFLKKNTICRQIVQKGKKWGKMASLMEIARKNMNKFSSVFQEITTTYFGIESLHKIQLDVLEAFISRKYTAKLRFSFQENKLKFE